MQTRLREEPLVPRAEESAGVQQVDAHVDIDESLDAERASDGVATDERFRTQLAAVVFEWRRTRTLAPENMANTLWMSRSSRLVEPTAS